MGQPHLDPDFGFIVPLAVAPVDERMTQKTKSVLASIRRFRLRSWPECSVICLFCLMNRALPSGRLNLWAIVPWVFTAGTGQVRQIGDVCSLLALHTANLQSQAPLAVVNCTRKTPLELPKHRETGDFAVSPLANPTIGPWQQGGREARDPGQQATAWCT